MTEQSPELAAAAAAYFQDRPPHRLWSGDPAECLDVELWRSLFSNGFTGVGIGERLGGSGGTAADAAVLLSLSGRFAAAIPLAEHLWLAGWVLAHADLVVPDGPITAAAGDLSMERTRTGWEVSGVLSRVAWARSCTDVVVLRPDGAVAVIPTPACSITHGSNIIGEPRDRVELCRVNLSADRVGQSTLTPANLLARGAVGRLIQVDGAAQAALERSLRYVGEREQFGRPLARFQAVQQRLAVVARECALLDAGVRLCLPAGGVPDRLPDVSVLDIAAAKLNAARAVPVIIANVHQVHGAIGITSEYGLGELTLRMSGWVTEFGTDGHWAEILAHGCTRDDVWDVVIGAAG
ncbi:MAG: acyl-CoA dehydrogenase family protein, partial [Mycobacteriaceae bacterium]